MRVSSNSLTDRLTRGAPAFSATLVGGLFALVVGLPLTSPDDLFGNTASIAVLSLGGAVVFGLIWANVSGGGPRRIRAYTTACIGLFGMTVVAALLIESIGDISNTVSYVVPIASVVFVSTAVFTPIIDRTVRKPVSLYLGLLLSVATIASGVIMAYYQVGFTEPPSLSLPPPA